MSIPVLVALASGIEDLSPVAAPELTEVTAEAGGGNCYLVIKYCATNCFVLSSAFGDVNISLIFPSLTAGTVVNVVCLPIATVPKVPPLDVFSSNVAPPRNIPDVIFISPIATSINEPPLGVGILPYKPVP